MKIFFHTLGCKVNQYETQEMREAAEKSGYIVTENEDEADIFVINSCTVTGESDRKTRQCVRHFKSAHENSVIVLTGCLPQSFPEMAESLTEADIVLGNKNNNLLIFAIEEYFTSHGRVLHMERHRGKEDFKGFGITNFEERTRAILKIEDGCDRYCSYCIIPKARGAVRSKEISDIKKEVKALTENGYSEIVLVGINLSSYGKGSALTLADAIFAVAENEKVKRIRLGSLEPDHLTDELLEKISKCDKLCPQFHISLQSGCDKILSKMSRHYTAAEYEHLCNTLRNKFSGATLTTDIMVGFPEESDEDFEKTRRFAEKIGFEKIHIFPYSRRSGTPADKMSGQISKSVKAKRASELARTAKKIREDFLKEQIGKTVSVLAEGKDKNGCKFGYTANYTPVKFTGDTEIGSIVDVKIVSADSDFCIGEKM